MSKKYVPAPLVPPRHPQDEQAPCASGDVARRSGESAELGADNSYGAFVRTLCDDITRRNAERLNRNRSATERGRKRVLSVVQDILSEKAD